MPEKKFSERAKWFLQNLQKLQDDFAESIGGQIVTTDKEGNLVTKMSGAQRACKLIMETEKNKVYIRQEQICHFPNHLPNK